jgi:branched-chain amino acid transport system substrate-binding protein
VVQAGGKSWFFLTVDYVFGHTMYGDASKAVQEAGGTVLGNVTHPINAADFSAYLLQAQASKAQIVGLANVGPDTTNAIKQAKEFGLAATGQRLAGFLVFITDVDAIGLDAAAGLLVTEGFYWDQNDLARAFAKRFMAKVGKMPSKEQAAGYAAVTHYLNASMAAGSKDAEAVNRQMRAMQADYFGKKATIREDGRVLFDLTLFEVKSPSESRYPWDYYKVVRTIPQAEAFRPTSEGGCYMYAKQG